MDKETALQIWDSLFGGREQAYDYASHPIRRDAYKEEDADGAWDLDPVQPLSRGGSLRADNLLPASTTTIALRQQRTSFKIGNLLYEVRKGPRYHTFALFDVTDRNKAYSLYPDEENQTAEFNERRLERSLGRVEKNVPVMNFRKPLENGLLSSTIVREGKKDERPLVEEKVDPTPAMASADVTALVAENEAEKNETAVEGTAEQEKAESERPEGSEEQKIEERAIENEAEPQAVPEKEEEERPIAARALSDAETVVEAPSEPLEEPQGNDETARLREEIESLKKTIADMDAAYTALSDEKKKEEEKAQALEDERRELLAQIQSQDERLAQTGQKEKDDVRQLVELESKMRGLAEELEKEQNRNGQTRAELEKAKTEKDALERQLAEKTATYEKSLKDKETTIEGLAAQKEAMESSAKAMNGTYDQRLADVAKEKEELQAAWSTKEKDLADRIASLESQKKALESEIATARLASQQQAEQSEQDAKEKEMSLAKMKDELDEALAQKADLETRARSLEEEQSSAREELTRQSQEFAAERKELEAQMERLSEEKKGLEEKVTSLEANATQLNEKGIQNETLLADKEKAYLDLTAEKERIEEERKSLAAKLEAMEKDCEAKAAEDERKEQEKERECRILTEKNLLLTLHGDVESYENIKKELESRGFAYDAENILAILSSHPEYRAKEDRTVYDAPKAAQEKKEKLPKEELVVQELGKEDISDLRRQGDREKNAFAYYDLIIGDGRKIATDFAGREIHRDCYKKKNSDYAWDFTLLDKTTSPSKENVLVANVKTLADFDDAQSFTTNGHTFSLQKEGDAYKVVSDDYVANPFDFQNAVDISLKNAEKKLPLIYIYVKVTGLSSSFADRKEVRLFFDVIDRTCSRCCPSSFLEMQAVTNASDYVFLTFDGTAQGAYKEAFDYAILLNSYRNAFKKRGGLNAIIVLDQVEVEPALKHLSYDRLYNETKDVDLNVIRYDLSLTTVVSSTIGKTVHIGPKILDKVPIDANKLKPSHLGHGNYANLFDFANEGFRECNFVFDLDRKEQSSD